MTIHRKKKKINKNSSNLNELTVCCFRSKHFGIAILTLFKIVLHEISDLIFLLFKIIRIEIEIENCPLDTYDFFFDFEHKRKSNKILFKIF